MLLISSCLNESNNDFNLLENEYNIKIKGNYTIYYLVYPTCESCYLSIIKKLDSLNFNSNSLILINDKRLNNRKYYKKLLNANCKIIFDDKGIISRINKLSDLNIPSVIMLNDGKIDTIININAINADRVFSNLNF